MASDHHQPTPPQDGQRESPLTIHFNWHWAIEYLIPGLLAAALAIGTLYGKWKAQERQHQEQISRMEEEIARTREAVRNGQAGEAIKRLFSEDAKEQRRRSPPEE